MNTKIRTVLAALLALALAVTHRRVRRRRGERRRRWQQRRRRWRQVIEKNPDNKGKSHHGRLEELHRAVRARQHLRRGAQGRRATPSRPSCNLGSEVIAFKALKQGEIDAYPEYTGTALTSFYKVKVTDVPKDPAGGLRPGQGEARGRQDRRAADDSVREHLPARHDQGEGRRRSATRRRSPRSRARRRT